MHPKEFIQYCPRCGSEQFAADACNSLSCGSCHFTLYYNAAAAADVIIENSRGEILMTRRARDPMLGMLDFPGGFVNERESAELAVCRETHEETGIRLQPDQLRYMASFDNSYVFGGMTYFALDMVFVAHVDDLQATHVGDDVERAQFLFPGSISPEDIGLPSTQSAFLHYMNLRRMRDLDAATHLARP